MRRTDEFIRGVLIIALTASIHAFRSRIYDDFGVVRAHRLQADHKRPPGGVRQREQTGLLMQTLVTLV